MPKWKKWLNNHQGFILFTAAMISAVVTTNVLAQQNAILEDTKKIKGDLDGVKKILDTYDLDFQLNELAKQEAEYEKELLEAGLL